MFKTIDYIIRYFLIYSMTIIDSLILIFSFKFRKSSYNFYKHYTKWSKRVLQLSGVKLHISGLEKISDEESYIFVSNHSSLYDIPVVFAALPQEVRIMYKKELEKVPVFGYGLKMSPFIAVERSDARDSMRSIEKALDLIRQDKSVILYPEGSRSKDGKMAKFKRGAFLMASRSGKKIVPISIKGSNTIIGKWKFANRDVYVKILEPVAAIENPDRKSENDLMETVWNKLYEANN